MSKKPDLYNRFLKFLVAVHHKNPELWVRRDKLKDYAFKEGYRSQTIWDAFEKLDENVHFGKKYDGETMYIYYELSDKEVKLLEEQIKSF